MFDHHFAFLDECGNENLKLDLPGVSPFFIISAVIANNNNLELLTRLVESVRVAHFQKGEMKSSSIGNNHKRRQVIIDSLMATGVRHITLIVNKAEIIRTGGLQYKRSFRKFLPGFIYNRLYKTFSNLTVLSDRHGHIKFMESVKKYVEKRHIRSLFEDQVFEFADSKEHVLIQAADVIAGTWAKVLDPNVPIEFQASLKHSLRENILLIDYWPPSKHSLLASEDNKNHLNIVVRQHCHQLAQYYIDDNHQISNLDPDEAYDTELRLATLRYLLMQNEVMENPEFVYGKNIIQHLKEIGFEELSLRRFANIVVSPLRDSDVIISSGNKGYRIPTTVEDIIEFAKTTGEKVVPMVIRLGKARDQLMVASEGQLDIVSESKHDIVNRFIEIQKEGSAIMPSDSSNH